MKGWVLDGEESDCAKWILKNFFTYRNIDCWDIKIPVDFLSKFEKDLINKCD